MRAFFMLTAAIAASIALSAQAGTVQANVKGMHCVSCAQAIEATLGEDAAVEKVVVDVKAGTATITEKPSQQIDDARVSALVKEAGYTVTGITRSAD